MRELLIRCSSIGKLMADSKTKTEVLSQGAKTYVRELAAQEIFGIDFDVTSKEIEKGIAVEAEAIALLNRVRGLNLTKNTTRRSNRWITGECDLFDQPRRRGHDLKSSWSAATFPLTEEDVDPKALKLYDFQMRGYMWLHDAEEWEINWALVNTPEGLIRNEPLQLHIVSHIPEHQRLTTITLTRDRAIEEAIAEKVEAARSYFNKVIRQFDEQHRQGAPAPTPVIDEMTAPWDLPTDAKPVALDPVVTRIASQSLPETLF